MSYAFESSELSASRVAKIIQEVIFDFRLAWDTRWVMPLFECPVSLVVPPSAWPWVAG
jgi:hypothetical protein